MTGVQTCALPICRINKQENFRMRILVAITNYGLKNQVYLKRLIHEYNAMSYDVDIVIFSNIPKDLGPNIEVKVGDRKSVV